MNISWDWLGELIDISNITPEQLSDQLTLAGFELESIDYNFENDTILQISSTTNRSDTTNFMGIAQEIASIVERKLDVSKTQINIPVFKTSIKIDNLCQEKYITSVIHNVHLQESPRWLKKRLALYQIKSINNLYDIINFIWIKWDQKIQVVDLNKESIQVNINNLNTLKTNRHIHKISIDNYSHTWKNKKNIILQLSIPETSITNNSLIKPPLSNTLYSLDSQQLPSQINYNYSMEAYVEAITLIHKLCQTQYPDKIIYLSTQYQIKYPISFNYDKNNKILGPTVSHKNKESYKILTPNTIDNIFNQLNFITHSQVAVCHVDIPSYRLKDIERDIDITEEISRLYGFNYFTDQLPNNLLRGNQSNQKYRLNQIRAICRSIGLHEVIHTSIGNQYPTSIYNPLNIDNSSIRNNLLWKLIQSWIYNIKQSKKSIEMFEIGRIFISDKKNYREKTHLAGILGGKKHMRSEWDAQPKNISWFQAKGDLEEIFERININVIWQKASQNNTLAESIFSTSLKYFKTNRCAVIYTPNQQPIGLFGEINIQNHHIQMADTLYGFEIALESLLKPPLSTSFKQIQPYTKYPSVTRDIKIEVPYHWPINKIFEHINIINEPIIESIELFDVYKNQDRTHKSLGFRITYSKSNSTLTTQEVTAIEQKFRNICVQ